MPSRTCLAGILPASTGNRRRADVTPAQPTAFDARFVLIDITGEGWEDALPQAPSLAQFIEQVEAGTFELRWQ